MLLLLLLLKQTTIIIPPDILMSDPMITDANAIATASNVVALLCMKFAYSKKSTKIV
jgi:hypothetical protein